MPSSASGLYDYNIERLKFRNKGAIKIPKSGDANVLNRETCYKLAIDVVIESVTKPEYRNLQTTPYHGFYGYATLVMRDCIAPKIQLQFGRNRIFEQRIVEAFQGWNDLAFYLKTTKRFLESLANSLRTGDPPSTLVNLCDVDAYSISWSEIDLRELYVLCPSDTQFRIELSWISPRKFTDDCGKEQNGKSKEPDDPKKDAGLPENGTQPKKNDANSPWAGNTPFTPIGADNPYFNPKNGNLNNANPDNTGLPPIEDSYGYFVKLYNVTRYSFSGVCRNTTETWYRLVPSGTTSIRTETDPARPSVAECDGTISYFLYYAMPSNQFITNWGGNSISTEIIRSPDLPPDIPRN